MTLGKEHGKGILLLEGIKSMSIKISRKCILNCAQFSQQKVVCGSKRETQRSEGPILGEGR